MKFGFIGLGQMGGGLARNLIRAGKEVLVYDLNTEAIEKTLKVGTTGARAKDKKELTEVDVLFTSLPLPTDIEQIMLGEDGLLNLMKTGSVYIDVSTIDPKTARKLFDAAEDKGIDFLECPLGLTPLHAEEGTLPIYVGGKKEVFEKMQDILEIIGGDIIYMGEVEASTAIKIISNLIGMTNVAIISEGIRIGEKAGIDRELLVKLLKDTGADSFQLNVRGPRIAHDDFDNKFGLDLALKDIRLGMEMADNWGNEPQIMRTAFDRFKDASANGLGKEDCNAIYKVIK